jgi:hypothetical protein
LSRKGRAGSSPAAGTFLDIEGLPFSWLPHRAKVGQSWDNFQFRFLMSTDGMATKTTMHINRKTRAGQAGAKTETITVSKRFANNLREFAYLLDDKRPLAEFLDEHCGWVLVNLVEEKASAVGEWCDMIARIAPWKTEAECQAFWTVSAQSSKQRRSWRSSRTTRARGMSQCLTPDTLIGRRSGCIAANTELSSRKHERCSCGAN